MKNPEQSPYCIQLPDQWTLPLIFSSPHSGNHYSEKFLHQTCLNPEQLRLSEDFNVHYLFKDVPAFGAPLIHANFPRAYCDVNRAANEIDLEMFVSAPTDQSCHSSPRVLAGLGTIPKLVSADTPIYDRLLPYSEAEYRLNSCYYPYHTALQRLIALCRKKFGRAFVIDCHSMPGNSEAQSSDLELADIVLGNRFGRTCPSEFSEFIAGILDQTGYTISFNAPYAGGYITQNYADPSLKTHTLQIELNRDLYMESDPLRLHDGHTELMSRIRKLLMRLEVYFTSTF